MTKAALGGRAIRRAVTRVKPEQASKAKSWTPTRLNYGEGCTRWGSNRQMHPSRSTGVGGTARRKGDAGNLGRPAGMRVATSNAAFGRRCRRESDGAVVPARPGNAGGGKGPGFWCACNEAEDR